MKILLDECVPVRLGKYFYDFTVSTVSKEQWTSLKNGKLMKTAIDAGFDVMLTVDKNLQY
jgi:predicted nuclease of predicted toxin-antitoxin system